MAAGHYGGYAQVGDMEQNISHEDFDVSILLEPTTTPITPTAPNGNDDTEENVANPEATNTTRSSSTAPSVPKRIVGSTISAFKYSIFTTFYVAILIPLNVLYSIGCFCLFGSDAKVQYPHFFQAKDDKSDPSASIGIYSKLRESNWTALRSLSLTITCRVGCLFLLWLVLSMCLPSLRRVSFEGLPLWKWCLLATLVSLGYPSVFLSKFLFDKFLVEEVITQSHNTHYLVQGLIDSVLSLIYIVFIFLVWMLYFHEQHRSLGDKYITKSLALVLVGAFLWVLKNAVLLRWKARAIYTRFRGRILMAGFRLFFLGVILDAEKIYPLLPWRYELKGGKWVVINDNPNPDPKGPLSFERLKKRSIQDYILSRHVSFHKMKKITGHLINLTKVSLREEDDVIVTYDIMEKYRQKIGPYWYKRHVTEYIIKNLVEPDDAGLLKEELEAEYPSKKINEVPFDKWVVDAHKSCVAVGYTLVDAFAMVKILNTILTWCLIVVVTLLWLLVTQLATMKVLVVIASPFLAFTFVFGDTCKTFFQGFIFAFITHPFTIGDRCIIDGVEVEVKRINIMTTTCLKIGTKEKMLYPNSDLASKLIINLGGKPDPTDFIELVLHSSTNMSKLQELRSQIENYFFDADEQNESFEKLCDVVVKEMGNGIKIMIHFQHSMDGQDVSHSQFLEKKEMHRSTLFIEIKQFLEKLKIQVATMAQ